MYRILSSRALLIALCTTALTLSACDALRPDAPAPSGLDPAGLRPSASAAPPAWLVPNAQRYRQQGARPATGRAGSATVMARALLSQNGQTLLQVTTGTLDAPAPPPGNLDKVQVKLLRPSGGVLWTRNSNGLHAGGAFTATYEGLARSMPLQVQVNVSGIDRKRTGVVTLPVLVLRRPDLRASGLQAPQQVHPGDVAEISAVVSEINGDVGATANCILSVDGTEADRATGIWVDAGDVVTCHFATRLTTLGDRQLRVSVEQVSPADDDLSNNAVTGTIAVRAPGVLNVSASAFGDRAPSYWRYTGSVRFVDTPANDYDFDQITTGVEQWSTVQAYTNQPFPMDLSSLSARVKMANDGTTLVDATFGPGDFNLYSDANGQQAHANVLGPEGRVQVSFYESTLYSYSYLYALRFAGAVTYHATYTFPNQPVNSYSVNYPQNTPPFMPYGNTFSFDVGWTWADGQFSTAGTFPFQDIDQVYTTPENCFDAGLYVHCYVFEVVRYLRAGSYFAPAS